MTRYPAATLLSALALTLVVAQLVLSLLEAVGR